MYNLKNISLYLFLITCAPVLWAQSSTDCPTSTAISPSEIQSVCVDDVPAPLMAAITPTQNTGSATDWLDLSNNSQTYSIVNGMNWSSANGGVMVLDGIDDGADDNGNDIVVDLSNPFTIEVYAFLDSFHTTYIRLLSLKTQTSDPFFVFTSTSSAYGNYGIGFGSRNGIKVCTANPNELSSGAWHRILVTWDGVGGYGLEIDNNPKALKNSSAYGAESNTTIIGNETDLAGGGWKGKISVVNVYPFELSTAQKTQNFDFYKNRFGLGTQEATSIVPGATINLDAGNPLSYNTGSSTVGYQWYYNTSDSNLISGATLIEGATAATYTPPSTPADLGSRYYFCVGYATDNDCGQTNATQTLASNTTQVTVNATPNLIITDPTEVYSPSTVNLTDPAVTAGSDEGTLSYWTDAGANNVLGSPEAIATSGTYYIKLNNAGECYTIKPVTVTISEMPPLFTTPLATFSDEITAPGRMAVDSNDNVYATDAIEHNIIKYDTQGNYLNTITTDFNPISIAINKNDQLFAGDQITGNIYKLAPNGTKSVFYSGTTLPNSMVFGLNNILYIVDSEQKKVIGLDGSGAVVTNFTSENFVFPTGIAYDKQNNHFIVSEHGGIGEDVQYCYSGQWNVSSWGPVTTIYILDEVGNLINQFGCFGTKDGEFQRIMGVSMGTCGNIYAVDPYLGRVSVFDDNGNYLTKFGLQGDEAGELNLPIDIVFTSDNSAFVSSMNKGAIDVFSITDILPTASITSDDQTICANASGAIEIDFTGNGPWAFTYTVDKLNPISINAEESPFILEVTEAGLYEVMALTDSNNMAGACFTGTTNITVNQLPTATILTSDFSKCQDENSGVEIQFTGIAPWTFTYTIDGLNPVELTTMESLFTIPAEHSGEYKIIELTDAMCTGDTFVGNCSVTIHPLPTASLVNEFRYVQANPGDVTDFGIALTGTAPWILTILKDEIEEYTIETSNSLYTFSISEESTYEIMSVADLYCSNNDWQCFFNLTFNDNLLPTATILTENIEMCVGATEAIAIEFTGESPWTFSYTIDGLNTETITTSDTPYLLSASSSGVYELSAVSDTNGDGTFSGLTTVSVLDQPVIDLGPDIYLCEGDPAYILDAGDFDTYLWSDGSTNRTLEVSAAGIYSVTVTNTSGCSATGFVTVVVNEIPTAEFFYDIDRLNVQFISDAENITTHYWEFGDGNSSIEENPIHQYKKKGTYTVTYAAISESCGAVQTSQTFKVGGTEDENLVVIYPNPSYGEFTLKITPDQTLTEDVEVLIRSLSGQTIFHRFYKPYELTEYNGSIYIKIQLFNFSKGIYPLGVSSGGFYAQEKLVLKD